MISTAYYTRVTPQDTFNLAGPHGDDPRISTARRLETESRPNYIHIPPPSPWSHETRPFLHNVGTTAQKNGNINYSCRLHGPLCCRDTYYCTRHRLAESTRQMEDGLHTDNRWTSQKKDKLWVVKMADSKTALSRYNQVVGAVCKNAFLFSSAKNSTNLTKTISWW